MGRHFCKASTTLALAAALFVGSVPQSAAGGRTGPQNSNLHASISPAHAGGHMVSWVVLSKSYVELDADKLRAALNDVFPGEFLAGAKDGSFVIDGPVEQAQFLVQSRVATAAGTFILSSVPGPYTMFSDFAKFISDKKMRVGARAQKNWMAIDLVAKHSSEEDAYRFIGIALAKLAPADATYLVHPTRRIVMPFNEKVRQQLAAGKMP